MRITRGFHLADGAPVKSGKLSCDRLSPATPRRGACSAASAAANPAQAAAKIKTTRSRFCVLDSFMDALPVADAGENNHSPSEGNPTSRL